MSPEMSKTLSASLVREAITKIREQTYKLQSARPKEMLAIERRIAELSQPLIDAMILCESQRSEIASLRQQLLTYGHHLDTCKLPMGGDRCTCGLRSAMEVARS